MRSSFDRVKSVLGVAVGATLFAGAAFIIHREVHEFRYPVIANAFRAIPLSRFLAAIALMLVNYLVLTGYDTLAFRYIQNRLSYARIAFTSGIAYAFSNNLGFAMLTGSAVRYRLYSGWGLSVTEITQVFVFNTVTFWLGFMALSGVFLTLAPIRIPASLEVPSAWIRLLGLGAVLFVAGVSAVSLFRKKPIRIFAWEFPIPSFPLYAAQVLISSLDWLLAGVVLYVLLPAHALTASEYMGIYLLAQIIALISHVPGGLGVFDGIILVLLGPYLSTPEIVAGLMAYRFVYYFLPLLVAAVMFAGYEIRQRSRQIAGMVRSVGVQAPGVIQNILSMGVLICGGFLLLSGTTPGVAERLDWLGEMVPLAVLEVAHFVGSLVGVVLLILARGIQRRLNGAYRWTLGILGLGLIVSLLKGLDWEETLILGVMILLLAPARGEFYRTARLVDDRFSLAWFASIVTILLGSLWLGFFAHEHVGYSDELWWRFGFADHASRFLRAAVGSCCAAVVWGVYFLLRPVPLRASLPSRAEMDRAVAIIGKSSSSLANLALLGDKSLLFSATGASFIMYGIAGRSWVSMGDPVGNEVEFSDLVWDFKERSERFGGRAIFYKVSSRCLPLYIDLGLSLLKLGEEAYVDLQRFKLEGDRYEDLRNPVGTIEREGFSFEVVEAGHVPEILLSCRQVSDEWLADRKVRERRFAMGGFDEAYLSRGPVAVVKKDERIVAFANLLLGSRGEELAVDLMRHARAAPPGVLDYLLVRLFGWGGARGYRWFNLGLAPLPGIADRPHASLWRKVGAILYNRGEPIEDLQGLRQFKEKFRPEWRECYLASPGGLALPSVLANLSSLISGGTAGEVKKRGRAERARASGDRVGRAEQR